MKRFLLLFLATLASGCGFLSDDDEPTLAGVYVGNQGNFSDENGSVTLYDPESAKATQGALGTLNGLVQDIEIVGNTGFVLLNFSTFNEGRIDLFDVETGARTAQITGVTAPRQMAVSGTKAYVTNLFDETVTVINLATRGVGDTIPVGGQPEGIVAGPGRIYVANYSFGAARTVSVIDRTTDSVVDTFEPGCDGPRFVELDGEGELWVFCTGKTVYNDDFTEIIEQTNGQVVVLDPADGTVIKRFELDAQLGGATSGQDVFYSADAEEAYAIVGTNVLRFDTDDNALAATIATDSDPLGTVAYDADLRRLYLGRVTGFDTAGYVSVHDRSGRTVGQFDAGIAPAAIAFTTE